MQGIGEIRLSKLMGARGSLSLMSADNSARVCCEHSKFCNIPLKSMATLQQLYIAYLTTCDSDRESSLRIHTSTCISSKCHSQKLYHTGLPYHNTNLNSFMPRNKFFKSLPNLFTTSQMNQLIVQLFLLYLS